MYRVTPVWCGRGEAVPMHLEAGREEGLSLPRSRVDLPRCRLQRTTWRTTPVSVWPPVPAPCSFCPHRKAARPSLCSAFCLSPLAPTHLRAHAPLPTQTWEAILSSRATVGALLTHLPAPPPQPADSTQQPPFPARQPATQPAHRISALLPVDGPLPFPARPSLPRSLPAPAPRSYPRPSTSPPPLPPLPLPPPPRPPLPHCSPFQLFLFFQVAKMTRSKEALTKKLKGVEEARLEVRKHVEALESAAQTLEREVRAHTWHARAFILGASGATASHGRSSCC